ncbi:FtsB family cell division protein [Mucilaginibacter myungsuensis]|uniref:Septum formation initiator family protein n=1 Tax=Mucilaginibacter myungsuensis TaxID=649104 RepID=A0A929L3W7_9SPHI|nr:septum formation initiator family protein [Mucilaginibacter myungsuensis]MBE9663555.1 septum formation initiator family protein [Mucilaginibacter myungsuensis]
MQRLVGLLKNKYFLSALAFVVWMLFFDKNDLISQFEYRQQVNRLRHDRDFYQKETDEVNRQLQQLTTNNSALEKFAREKYLMKKENEDVFVVVKEAKKED